MGTKLTHEQKGQLADQISELYRITSSGIRPYEEVRRGIQAVIEGSSPAVAPSSWPQYGHASSGPFIPEWMNGCTPAQQVERALEKNSQSGFDLRLEILAARKAVPEFVPETEHEGLVLSLVLPPAGRTATLERTVRLLWGAIEPPAGFSKYVWDGLEFGPAHLRVAPHLTLPEPGVYWVGYDPCYYRNRAPQSLVEAQEPVAIAETLSALALVPGMVAQLGNQLPHQDIAGLQYNWDGDDEAAWSGSPYVQRWALARRLKLRAGLARDVNPSFGSARVRKC